MLYKMALSLKCVLFYRAVYDYIDCDANAVSNCGQEAVKFLKEYNTRYVKPYMKQFDCHKGISWYLITICYLSFANSGL